MLPKYYRNMFNTQVRGVIVRMEKTNAILKLPVKKKKDLHS